MLIIRNLSKRYDDRTALDHLSLEVGKGVIFGLLGPNGAGKTTLVSLLNGLLDFEEGSVEVFGLPLGKNLAAIRSRCALVPQALALYDRLTVRENLRFFADIQMRTKEGARKNIDKAIAITRLEGVLHQKAVSLSGGQKRRLNIAIGLLNDPDLLYFDEPTAGVDAESRNEILDTIRAFKRENKTVIYTSHYLPEIEKICDEAAILDKGRVVRQGKLSALLQEGAADSALIEIVEASLPDLHAIAAEIPTLRVVDQSTLLLTRQNSTRMGVLLMLLERGNIAIKQIRYGTDSLESFFIRLIAEVREP